MAFAKQIGHFRLHLLVRSTLARAVWLRCRSHRPQSNGHCLAFGMAGSLTPTPSLAHFSTRLYMAASDQMVSLKLPCFGQDFSMTTFPSSSRMVAGMMARHSGQRLSVFFGSPAGMLHSWVSISIPIPAG